MNELEKYKKKYIIYNGKNIYYYITYKKVKNINIKIRDKIYITASPYVAKEQIINIIYSNIKKIEEILNKNNNNIYYNLEKNIIRIMGDNYKIVYELNKNKNTWKVIQNTIKLNLKNITDKEKVIKKILKKYSQNYIKNRIEHLSEKININYNTVNLKWMTRKWGYCDNKNNIVISTKTIILDLNMIDYIIIHELCHVIEHNHSNKFWILVKNFIPNYKEIDKKIKLINLI